VLVVALVGGVASGASRALAHSFSFGIRLAALTNIAQYVAWNTSKRKGSFVHKYGPLFLTCLAVPLVMADLTRHVLLDSGYATGACAYSDAASYVADQQCRWNPDPNIGCWNTDFWHSGASMYYGEGDALSFTGVMFTIVLTYTGFACMIIGVFWNVDIMQKIKGIGSQLRALLSANRRV